MALSSFDIDAPRWDQSFGQIETLLQHHRLSNKRSYLTLRLDEASFSKAAGKTMLSYSEQGPSLGATVEQLFSPKLCDSAFHPDTGRPHEPHDACLSKSPGMAITGFMLHSCCGVLQRWVNRSFNALVNYTDRSAASPITPKQIGIKPTLRRQHSVSNGSGLNTLHKSMKAAVKGINAGGGSPESPWRARNE
ncbi:sideroflexin-2 [Lates japonicus]|uniref:Sideroflexin-2 n=1 Tax=Lates japonicus TaxID=270547 RepID=A0AAD3RK60_LATJO|nr:sideroflexin-2 [Lates japonicus]